MWAKSENSEPIRPLAVEVSGSNVIVRRNVQKVEATEERGEHYTYDEWQMTAGEYEVYAACQSELKDQSDALVELADLIVEVLNG